MTTAPRHVQHLSREQRVARGLQAREEVPLELQGEYESVPGRADPVTLLQVQAQSRVPELVPIRYGRMLVSPFTFYRGAAAIMAADLATTPDTGLRVQLCGDAHLSNFGMFAAPDRRLVLDINDFDETIPGPWEWDVKRLAASFEVAGRDRGFTDKQRRGLARSVGRSYREAMAGFAGQSNLAVWYARLDTDALPSDVMRELEEQRASKKLRKETMRRLDRAQQRAMARDSLGAFAKLTEEVDGRRRFVSRPPLIVRYEELGPGAEALPFELMRGLVRSYRRSLPEDRRHLLQTFEITDLARKVVGVGSVGTRAYVLLLRGVDDDDPLILQAKEAQSSVLEPYVGRSRHANHGQRVVEGQRLMQAASDIFLGWDRVTSPLDGQQRDFYVRQLWDGKFSPLVDTMPLEMLDGFARMCGWTLARAHARSGDRIAISAYLGEDDAFERAIGRFAATYADQNDRDHAALERAVKDGEVEAQTGL